MCGEDKKSSGEGVDRCDLQLTGRQNELIRRVSALKKPLVLLVQSGRPLALTEAYQAADAMLVNLFGGDFGGVAAAEAIYGQLSPAGRLPISFPRSVGQIPSYYSRPRGRNANDYYEGSGRNLFEFGFGLTYTSFSYSDLTIENKSEDNKMMINVRFELENTGTIASDEVVQLYIQDVVSSVSTPKKRLRGVKRIHLLPPKKNSPSLLQSGMTT